MKEGLPFARDLSLENSVIFTYVFNQLYFTHSALLLFPQSITFFIGMRAFRFTFSILSINPSANMSPFGDFNVHHKDWLTYSGRTDKPGELCYHFFYLK